MCGAFHLVKEKKSLGLMSALGTPEFTGKGLCVPASTIEIVLETESGRRCQPAKWWLLLGKDGKPNYQYATFNSRYDKLRSSFLTKKPYQTSRCIIPASLVIEGQNKKYHSITGKDRALALGGLYKTYQVGDETVTTASIITCPGHTKWTEFHAKSTPLFLDVDDTEGIGMWLDPTFNQVEAFDDWLTGRLPIDVVVTPMAGARDLTAAGPSFLCGRD